MSEAPVAAPVRVRLPVLFASLFPTAERELQLAVATVAELMDALDARWPGMRDRLCDSTPAIRRHINVFVNGESGEADTPVGPDDRIDVLPAISGGCK